MKKIVEEPPQVKVWSEAISSDGYKLKIKALYASPFYANILERNWVVKAVLFAAFDKNKNNTGCCLLYHHLKAGNVCRVYIPRLGFWGDNKALKKLSSAVTDYCVSKKIEHSISPLVPKMQEPLWNKHYLIVKLGGTDSEIFSKLRKKTRYIIRRSEKTLNVAEGNEYILQFYEIYKTRMLAKKLSVKPFQYFEKLLNGHDDARLFVTLNDGRLVSGMIFCKLDKVAYYLYNSATPEGLSLNANHFLMWQAMSYYNGLGVASIDLGESSEGSGTYLFKKIHFNGEVNNQEYSDIIGYTHSNNQKLNINYKRRIQYQIAKVVPKAFSRELASYNQIL